MPPAPTYGPPAPPITPVRPPSSRATSSPLSSSTAVDGTTETASDSEKDQGKTSEERERLEGPEEAEGRLHGNQHPYLSQESAVVTDRVSPEEQSQTLASLHQSLIATQSTTSCSSSITASTPAKTPVLEKLSFFYRGRRSQVTISPTSSTTTSMDLRHQSMASFRSPRSLFDANSQLLTPPSSPNSPDHNSDGVSDSIPRRQINTTDDKLLQLVRVRYRGEYASICVGDNTDTVDVLRQAAELMNSPINTAASIVYECYAPLGIERRLRRYERIREVVESWPRNAQNSLLIRHAWGPDNDKDLDISFVPVGVTPTPFVLYLYQCSRSGKWQKRWVSLLADGQMLSSKTPDFSPGKDCQPLCDLSEYDIYNFITEPATLTDDGRLKTARTSPLRNLKAPKRYAFALRSQQRPTTYPSASTYVHFFCTENPAVARRFSTLVHAWRSWYMVKSRRDVQRKKLMDTPTSPISSISPAPQITPVKHEPQKSVSHVKVSPGHKMKLSVDETPYTIGEFQPFVDIERFNKPADEFGIDWIPDPRSSLPPVTPGTDSGASFKTPPSTDEFLKEDRPDMSSPSEERRKRRDLKSLPAIDTGAQAASGEGSANITIAITEPMSTSSERTLSDATWNSLADTQPTEPEPSSPVKPEPESWLPSAAEHTANARRKAEQERLERLNNPPVTPQRPVINSGVVARGGLPSVPPTPPVPPVPAVPPIPERRGGRYHSRSQPIIPGHLAAHYRAASQWAEAPSGARPSRHLEVPAHSHGRSLTSMVSMPALTESPNTKHLPAQPSPVPRRDRSLSSSHPRPMTSYGERTGGPRQGQLRARSGSGTSLRRGYNGALAAPPLGAPPMPPMPVRLNVRPPTATKDGVVVVRPPGAAAREAGRNLAAKP